jgi:hypothetical protein
LPFTLSNLILGIGFGVYGFSVVNIDSGESLSSLRRQLQQRKNRIETNPDRESCQVKKIPTTKNHRNSFQRKVDSEVITVTWIGLVRSPTLTLVGGLNRQQWSRTNKNIKYLIIIDK